MEEKSSVLCKNHLLYKFCKKIKLLMRLASKNLLKKIKSNYINNLIKMLINSKS